MDGHVVMILRLRKENLRRERGQKWKEERCGVSFDDMM